MNNEDIKKFYNTTLKNSYKNDYEFRRWFESSQKRAGFFSTKNTLEKLLINYTPSYKSYIELGPGPGTWTQLFLKQGIMIDFVDISEEMLKMLKVRFTGYDNMRFFCSDFLLFNSDRTYDLFFSSRAIEYFDNKQKLVSSIYDLLNVGGMGIVVTKMPHYRRSSVFKKTLTSIHQSQIHYKELTGLLEKQGCAVLGVYGTTFVFPFVHSGLLDRFLYKIFARHPLNSVSSFFCESYTVVFKKT